jgi:hypothetical protein
MSQLKALVKEDPELIVILAIVVLIAVTTFLVLR